MTLSQKAVDFMARHQFSTIAGCWALGITGAFGMIMRNPWAGYSAITRPGLTNALQTGIKVCHKRYGVV